MQLNRILAVGDAHLLLFMTFIYLSPHITEDVKMQICCIHYKLVTKVPRAFIFKTIRIYGGSKGISKMSDMICL